MAKASAPGKCILFGEHAVVYGHPAIALAIDQRMTMKVSPSKQWRLDGMPLNFERHPHIQTLKNRLWADGPPLSIEIHTEIPPGSGLGSSAALSVAAAAVLRSMRGRHTDSEGNWCEGWSSARENDVYNSSGENRSGEILITGKQSIDIDECAILAHAVEANAQGGRASPIDSSTCAHGGCILLSDKVEDEAKWLYSRTLNTPEKETSWQIHSLELPSSLENTWLVIGNTEVHSPTSIQVEKVAQSLQTNPQMKQIINAIGMVTRRGITALQEGNLNAIGNSMTENHILLRSLGVSCPELERLIAAALPTSYGAKLTGAGGGGCMIALTDEPKRTSEAIELAGGRTMITRLASMGLQGDKATDKPLWNPFQK
jgi:mevalonate kinase